ncbi:hypothetical protein Cgig2_021684 [Carnegiea gigantea]|uniref:Uncharacterized protein n=1 Tax=Carnegiea gigantea TaxID=171969 RepID=A0A9Q1QR28_9CARY|nr:hypothetical protein Cgig2_021684 [Carnegiea gigantea]
MQGNLLMGVANRAHGGHAEVHNGGTPQLVRQKCEESGAATNASSPTVGIADGTVRVGMDSESAMEIFPWIRNNLSDATDYESNEHKDRDEDRGTTVIIRNCGGRYSNPNRQANPLSMAPRSTDVEGAAAGEARMDPLLLGPSLETMRNAEGRR